jgi:DNA invertase Pin-like site-specific DNA recombinase
METKNPLQVNPDTRNLLSSPVKVKYCLYARKSTESEERQILSIESQVHEMLQIAEREGLEIVDIRRESHSAKDSGQRPVFKEILMYIKSGRYSGILTWAPDRLSRNAGDLGSLVDLIDQKALIEIKTYGQVFSNSPSDKFLLMILCSQAKLENDNKSVNVKRGLRTRCEMGLWPAPAPTGYLNEKRIDRKGYVMIDTERAPVIKKMFEKVAYEKWSGRKIYHWLKFEMNFRSSTSNKPLTLSNIYKLLQTPFYYGKFEYPVKSGNWYTGKHEPLINIELFEKVREQLKRSEITHERKDYAFSRLMTCGLCGSGICAEDKYKKLKNGGTAHYIYYGCNRSKNLDCKCGYLREEELIKQLVEMIDKIEVDQKFIKGKFEQERERMVTFQKQFYGVKQSKLEIEFDSKKYTEHILTEGTVEEKREMLANLDTRITMKNKIIYLNN